MLKKTITYVDFNDEEQTETLYFNLTRREALEMQYRDKTRGLDEFIKEIVDTDDTNGILSLFKWFILQCYGEKSEDGKRFIKSKQLSEAFSQTAAFEELYWEIAQSAESAAAFIKGVLPKGFEHDIEKMTKDAMERMEKN